MLSPNTPKGSPRVQMALWLLILASALLASVVPAQAQTMETFEVTLEELGYDDRTLHGPSSEVKYYFSLPANWAPQPGSYLRLNFDYQSVGQAGAVYALLRVELNGEILYQQALEPPALSRPQLQADVPLYYLFSAEEQPVNEIQLSLEIDAQCRPTSLDTLVIRSSSLLHINYTENPLNLDLAQYPSPIHQAWALQASQARFVLPTAPDMADVQAATIIAARLGNLANNELPLAVGFASSVQPTVALEEHLFVIGQPEHNALIHQLYLPLPVIKRQMSLHSEVPSVIVPGRSFTYSLTVANTTEISRGLVVEDRWPLGITLVTCQYWCENVAPNTFRWYVGQLEPGQEASNDVQMILDPSLVSPGDSVEHTASLLDSQSNVLNVDTLAATVSVTQRDQDNVQIAVSSLDKSPYFFVNDGRGVAEGDGIIQEAISPWSTSHAAIVVTGLNKEAVLKAGQALGAETSFPGMSGPFAIVQDTRPLTKTEESAAEDISFDSLGYGDDILNILRDSTRVYFQMPGEWAPTEAAGLALRFAHSEALNEISATLEIELNRVPVYGIQLDQNNAYSAWRAVPLPPDRLNAGSNQIRFQLTGDFERCINTRLAQGYWLTLYSDSFLHLPHELRKPTFDLSDFPRPFSDRPDLANVIFLLPDQPVETDLGALVRLAAFLGDSTRSHHFLPQVVLGGDIDQAAWADHRIIALGRPTTNPYIAAVNDSLPQPFVPGTDEIRQQVDNVVYRLPSGYSLGYVQLLTQSRYESDALLIVTGSTDDAVAQTVDVLVNDDLDYKLAGNLAIISQEGELHTTDTRAPVKEAIIPYPEPVAHITPEATIPPTLTPMPMPTPVATSTPILRTATPTAVADDLVVASSDHLPWLIPLLTLSVLVLIVAAGIYIRQVRS
jgi:hypothetical protein